MEGADPIETPSQLGAWTERGVRIIGPAWGRTRYAGGTGAPGGLTALGGQLLKRCVLPSGVHPGRQRPGQDALALMLGLSVVDPIARRHGDAKEVDARVEWRRTELGPLDIPGGQHAGEEQREL